MKAVKMGEKWYIGIETKTDGNVILLNKDYMVPIPLIFDNKEEAEAYIEKNRDDYEDI